MIKKCFQCEHENHSPQNFCGNCGAPLALSDFVAIRVATEVANAVKDRDVLEKDSAIKVFERAYGWVKIVGGIGLATVALVSLLGLWKASDWWATVDRAKRAVTDSASHAEVEIDSSSKSALSGIQTAAKGAKDATDSLVAVLCFCPRG
jgi:hypothetical protein